MNGQPCIRGQRLTVKRVIDLLATYPDRHELTLPGISRVGRGGYSTGFGLCFSLLGRCSSGLKL
ncbi:MULTISPECIES: DUF433 domain-containing protein [unclassified Synechocystis]|uniref:DUF433 domain-containing protein n=1 Tax=unclassified Synechocystis TaxID=2640012 RepID=UPI001E5A8DF9|nr:MULTISPECIES: DUF433 domain-containing protein [unclassified Synechocystis]UOO13362.1 DUF433 domain-containing protein [Synechocystis sp. PCC 6803]